VLVRWARYSNCLLDEAVWVARYVKDHYPAEKFEETFLGLVSGYWSRGIDISTPRGIIKALESVFSPGSLEHIMEGSIQSENKERVVETTLSIGAFGAPWISAINTNGERRDWFGNDRWHQIFHHIGIPFTPITIIQSDMGEQIYSIYYADQIIRLLIPGLRQFCVTKRY
jgi:glutathione S-transferase kappa 1